MGWLLAVASLLALAACGAEPAPAPPQQAVPTTSNPVSPSSPVSPADARSTYKQEVDDLFRTMNAQDASPAPNGARAPAETEATAPGSPRVIHGVAPSASAPADVAARAAEQQRYEENLAGCLDGRFFAFCDHAMLTPADAARVEQAEITANQTTCIDPQWQQLCRPELLPSGGDPAPAPDQPPTP
ncbi:MAG: hypothetical protein U1E52_06610 [Geminicoccaceae bacterium]